MKKAFVIVACLCAMLPVCVFSQVKRDSLSDVAGYIRQLIHQDNYSYQYSVKTVYPDRKVSILKGTVYRSVKDFRFYSETDKDIMLLTRAGMLTISHGDKRIFLKKFESDSEYHALHIRFTDSDMMGAMLDSVFTKAASVRSTRRASGHLYVVLAYKPGAMLNSLNLDYLLQARQVASLSYTMTRVVTAGAEGLYPVDTIKQEVNMNGFKKGRPAMLTALAGPDTYTEIFLQTRYKDYQIQKL